MGAEKSIVFLSFCPHFSAKNSSTFEATATVNSAVPTGRRMNGAEMFMRRKNLQHPSSKLQGSTKPQAPNCQRATPGAWRLESLSSSTVLDLSASFHACP